MKTIPEMLKSLTRGTEGITSIQETVSSTETRITFASPNPADEAMFSKIYHQVRALREKLLEIGINPDISSSNAEASVCINQQDYGQVREAYKKHLVYSVTTPAGLASLAGHAIQDGAHFLSQKAKHQAEKFHERRNSGQDAEIKR